MRWQFLTRLINAQLSNQKSVFYIPLNVLGWVIINIRDLYNGLNVEILFFTWLVLYPLCLTLLNNSELSSPVVFFSHCFVFSSRKSQVVFSIPRPQGQNQVHRPQGPAGLLRGHQRHVMQPKRSPFWEFFLGFSLVCWRGVTGGTLKDYRFGEKLGKKTLLLDLFPPLKTRFWEISKNIILSVSKSWLQKN